MGLAIYGLMRTLTVEIPLFRCACIDSSGQDFDEAQAVCRRQVPHSLRGRYETMVALESSGGGGSAALCRWYGETVQKTTLSLFDEWFVHSERAADALSSFLQDLVMPSGGVDQCLSGSSNPYAIMLMPTPSTHFHVCGQTSACRLRCAQEWSLFDLYVARATGAVSVPPQLFSTSVVRLVQLSCSLAAAPPLAQPMLLQESPLFNVYGTSSASGAVTDRIAALVHGGPLCTMCQDSCVSVLTTPWEFDPSTEWVGVRVVGYCIPAASSLTSYVFQSTQPPIPITAPAFVAGSGSGSAVLTYADFARQPAYVVLGFTITTTLAGQRVAQKETSHVVYVVPLGGSPSLFLHSLTLQAQVLSLPMQRFLFGGLAPPGP
jgi:hypothetical protein